MALTVFLVGSAAAQPTTPECIGGTRIDIQPGAITVKRNRTVRAIQITANTEIWRRGVDLDSPAKLVPGEQIFPICKQTAADGLPVATLLAAAEGQDAMYLEPHHVHEVRPCGGGLTQSPPGPMMAKPS